MPNRNIACLIAIWANTIILNLVECFRATTMLMVNECMVKGLVGFFMGCLMMIDDSL